MPPDVQLVISVAPVGFSKVGILPLLFASGAGANSRISVGSTVIGGMITAATLGTVLTPAFYVIVQDTVDKYFNNKREQDDEII